MLLDFGLKDFIDIFLVALMLFYIYRLMKESRSMNVFVGIILFVLVWLFVSGILEMKLLGSILDKLVSVGGIAIIIIFQDEIKKFLYNLGTQQHIRRFMNFFRDEKRKEVDKSAIIPLVMACMSMAKNKVGALIVIERAIPLDDIVSTGETIDANVNQLLLENIFFKNSPLHDGAVISVGDRIESAACILPLSQSEDLPKSFGLRHRSAMGIAEKTNAVAVVVSEETGNITVFHKGSFQRDLTVEQLTKYLVENVR